MKNSNFVHCHIHSEYSFLDGFGNPIDYAKKAKELGFKYLACTDHGSIDGLIKFQQACQNNDIIPIFGSELYITPEVCKERKNGHILLLVKNNKGFRNLCKLLSFANTDGFYYKPRITSDMLLKNCKGLVISTACPQSFVTNNKDGLDLTKKLINRVGDDFYFELMPINTPLQNKHNQKIIRLTRKYNQKIIITNDCHYINEDDWEAQEMLLAIQTKVQWSDKNRFKFNVHGLYLKSANQMIKDFKKISTIYKNEWIANTIEIAEKCRGFKIRQRKVKLPSVLSITGSNRDIKIEEHKILRKKCLTQFKKIFYDGIVEYNKKPYIKNWPVYYNRFKEEFDLFKRKNFVRYFLIVEDFVSWCRQNDVLVGPGRGSVGGSLVAYLLQITEVDPIIHNLLFSRFINEDRIDYPDIDIDIEDTKIHLARQYLEDKYGYNNVVGVSSFSRMKSRVVVKDIARVYSIPDQEVNRFTKLIDQSSEDGITNAISEYEEAKYFADEYPKVIKMAKKLEGQVRNRSQHAAALVVSDQPLSKSNRGNLIRSKNTTLINWEKDDAEYMGLMKLDILSLKLLSVLSETRRLIKENTGKTIIFPKIPLDDKEVLMQINNGNNIGLFQMNAWAMNSLIKDMGVDSFDNIVAAAALVRPGPTNSGMTLDYIKRKHGQEWVKKHDAYEEITKDTYGLVIYQEQIMQVINIIAGLPYSTADKIRKIIGKKRDVSEFKPYRKQFLRGCQKQKTLSIPEAKDFWEGLLKWAGYGFPKSHSLEYGMIGYWTAFLKYYYPTEFISASLTYGDKDKKEELVEEVYRLGLNIVLPRVNGETHPIKWVAKDNKIYVPFIEIKGVGPVKAYEIKDKIQPNEALLFDIDSEPVQHSGSLGNLLNDIDAYRNNDDLTSKRNLKNYFKFRIIANPTIEYKYLYKMFSNRLRLADLDKALQGDYSMLKKLSDKKRILKRTSDKKHRYQSLIKRLEKCTSCSLINECSYPVPPSIGKYNIAIYGQDPGFEEDIQGEGFVGAAGQKLWKSINPKEYPRSLFFVSNINKCFPSKSGKSSDSQIKACSRWGKSEIKLIKPIIILALGNSCLKYFKNQKGGINELSGKTEWNEKFKCWICWCTHPSAVLHNSSNEVYYKSGINNFIKTIKSIGIKKSV